MMKKTCHLIFSTCLSLCSVLFLVMFLKRFQAEQSDNYDSLTNRNKEDRKVVYKDIIGHEQNAAKKVLLYTYMRGGSSFLGELFRKNPDALYWFEAIDGFYQDTLMTVPHTHPLDILWFRNGTKRQVTHDEAIAVAEFHKNLFTCNYRDVPMSFFTDRQHIRSSRRFGAYKLPTGTCRAIVAPYCKRGPNVQLSVHHKCFEKYWRLKKHGESDENTEPIFNEFIECQNKVRDYYIKNWENHTLTWCKKARIHAAKEIRLTMELVDESMRMVPDMYLVYSVRDPRAIISSRYGTGKKAGLMTFEIHQEADILCQRIRSDMKIVKELEQKYANRILSIEFEKLVTEPFKQAKLLYDFIDEDLPQEIINWIKTSTGMESQSNRASVGGKFTTVRSNSSAIANAWRNMLRPDIIDYMNGVCKDVLDTLNYKL